MATTVKRIFNLSTRTLKAPSGKCYVGQVYDHISTTLEFTYDPINALSDGYVPYIVFNLYDDAGNLFVYGPGSAPVFDGYTFEIPTAVTSRIRGARLDYQVWLIRNRLEWDGRIETLGDTEYLFSAMDSLAFKDGLRCRQPSRNPCAPPQPCLEPGTLGWVNYLRDHCVLTPVQEFYGALSDGVRGVSLLFPTYNESKDCVVELRIPYLDSSGRVDINTHLPMISTWEEAADTNLADALMLREALESKLDDSQVIHSWDDFDPYRPDSGTQIASATLSKLTFDTKTDKTMSVAHYDPVAVYNRGSVVVWTDGPYAPDMYICMADGVIGTPPDDTSVWSCVSEQNMILDGWDSAPWEGYGDNPAITVSAGTLRRNPVPFWAPEIEYPKGAVVVERDTNTLFISMDSRNRGNSPYRQDDPSARIVNQEWWTPVRGAGGTDEQDFTTRHDHLNITTYRFDLGCWVISHTFNTYNVFVQVRRNVIGDPETGAVTDRTLVDARIEPIGLNEVAIRLDSQFHDPEHEGFTTVPLIAYVSPGGGRDAGKTGVEGFQLTREKGERDGYAGLDATGRVPAAQLPMMTSWGQASMDSIVPAVMVRAAVDHNSRLISERTEKVDFGRWSADSRYSEGSVVTHAGRMYIATRYNTAVDPSVSTDGTWAPIATASPEESVSRYVLNTSVDGTELVVEHNLGTRNLVFSVRAMADDRFLRDYDVYALSDDTARFVFPSAPGMVAVSLLSCPAPPMDSVEEVVYKGVNPWVYENTTGAPVFVQSIMASGDLGFAVVDQDPASEYDPVTVRVMSSVPDGTLVAGKADYARRFTRDDLEVEPSTGEYVLHIAKTDLASDLAWYAVQVYLDGSGQALANVKQNGSEVTVGMSSKTIENSPDIAGTVILKRATQAVTFEMGQIEDGTLTLDIPAGRTAAGVQLFIGAEGDMMMSDIRCIDGKVTARFSEPDYGTAVLI